MSAPASVPRPLVPVVPVALVCALVATLAACGVPVHQPRLHPVGGAPAPSAEAPWLEAHLHSGSVALLRSWEPGPDSLSLVGEGVLYDARREPLDSGRLDIPADSIALLESNRPDQVSELAFGTLITWTAASAVVAIHCGIDPKACFGSCPTFYLEGEDGERLVAEGFSSSFARVLEATDVDALPQPAGEATLVRLLMRNEAPETHALRSVRLLAVPLAGAEGVLADPAGTFHRVGKAVLPLRCTGPDGACLADVALPDGRERTSPADPGDLAAREVLELEFPPAPGELGVAVRARASLVSTFLFYHTISTLGEDAGDWLAALERGDPLVVERALGVARELGPVRVQVAEGAGPWRPVGTFDEAGPIAADTRVLPLGESSDAPLRVRLEMARGSWRIDAVQLVPLRGVTEPVVVEPTDVVAVRSDTGEPLAGGRTDAAGRLAHPDRYLVTRRGEAYRLTFELPGPAARQALFLESRGYYYEWMREEWRGQEDPVLASLLFADPREALRRLAPAYKEREAGMERAFWSSRFRGEGR